MPIAALVENLSVKLIGLVMQNITDAIPGLPYFTTTSPAEGY